jgi:tetratricopeptide (TPR) repeat protein
MKKMNVVLMLFIVILALAGCQDRQPRQKQAAPPPMPLITPDQIQHLENAAKMAPKNAGAWIALGNALMDTQRLSEAIDAYQKALALDPKNVDVRVDMGTCYFNSGQPEKALDEFRKAIKTNPNHVIAHRNSGVVLSRGLNRPAEAAREFEKYLELAPNAHDAGEIRQLVQQLKAQTGQR